jgi:CRP-like cAMP-binding protein
MPVLEAYAQASLSRAVLEELLSMGKLVRYDDGELIFREGDHALNLYIVERGKVAVELNLPPEGIFILTTVETGEWFSWSALLEPRIERATARAVGATEVWAIRGGAIMDRALENHEFGFQIYRALAELIATRLTHAWLQILQSRTA